MIRALPALIVIVVLIAVAIFIADRPGTVELDWQGWRVDTNVAVLALGVVLLGMIAAGVFHLLRRLVTAPAAYLRWRRERRREAGFRALTQGMVAVAAGDPEEAIKHARRADVLLAEPPLTLLLSAQAAQLNGDHTAAQNISPRCWSGAETEFLGLRGLLMQALHAGDEAAALKLVERAKRIAAQDAVGAEPALSFTRPRRPMARGRSDAGRGDGPQSGRRRDRAPSPRGAAA